MFRLFCALLVSNAVVLFLVLCLSVSHYRPPKARNITILLWHWPFRRAYNLSGDVCQEMYSTPGCHLTDDRGLLDHSDAVVFHHQELKIGQSRLPLHLPRPATQRWIWLSLEAPANNGDLAAYAGVFNLTMTYRRDADIFMPYGKLVPRKGRGQFVIPQKRHLACWVVSNYWPSQERARVYRALSKLIPLEVYGGWARRPLPTSDLLLIASRCHFYLAFENSISRDYITEKLWRNAFQAGSVPVVLGPSRADYEAQAPARSFIHVDDFNSTASLAGFLRRLASDRERYASYFEWRRANDVKLYTDWRERLCSICTQYHHLPPNKVYRDLHSWLNG